MTRNIIKFMNKEEVYNYIDSEDLASDVVIDWYGPGYYDVYEKDVQHCGSHCYMTKTYVVPISHTIKALRERIRITEQEIVDIQKAIME